MLSLQDFEHKKIVLISNFSNLPNQIRFLNNNIRLYKNNTFINQVNCENIFCIYILGNTTITTTLVDRLVKKGISIFFLTNSFNVYASINSKAEGHYLLRQKQYQQTEYECFSLSKILVKNKVYNQARMLKKCKKDYNSITNFELDNKITSYKELLGFEGSISSIYFKHIFSEQYWYRRSPQTKEDITNLLLDIGYTYMFNYIDSLLNLFGFDTYKGFYHKLYFQRKSLSCDLMEPFRVLVDYQVVKSYNLGQVNKKDFSVKNGSYSIKRGKGGKYANIFFNLITDYQQDIYNYVKGYYLFIQYPEKYKFPQFKI